MAATWPKEPLIRALARIGVTRAVNTSRSNREDLLQPVA